jgi:hypothetical protein
VDDHRTGVRRRDDACDAGTAIDLIRPPITFDSQIGCQRGALFLTAASLDLDKAAYPIITCQGTRQSRPVGLE